jgi:uncharacterized protein YdhG (YjbR/CyaY superfamily)
MDDAVTTYRERVPEEHRPLFERLHRLITDTVPEVSLGMGYGMPMYQRGGRRLYLATWKHGISLYGWDRAHDGGFAERHPGLLSGRSTIRLRPSDDAGVSDDELVVLIRNSLSQ